MILSESSLIFSIMFPVVHTYLRSPIHEEVELVTVEDLDGILGDYLVEAIDELMHLVLAVLQQVVPGQLVNVVLPPSLSYFNVLAIGDQLNLLSVVPHHCEHEVLLVEVQVLIFSDVL
jgi:hypothetical protein